MDLPVEPPRALELRALIEAEGFTLEAFSRGTWFEVVATPAPGAGQGTEPRVLRQTHREHAVAALGLVWDGVRTDRGDPPRPCCDEF